MRILLVSPYGPPAWGLEVFYKNAFDALDHETRLVAITETSRKLKNISGKVIAKARKVIGGDCLWFWDKGESILAAARQFSPDITIVIRCENLHPSAIRALNELSQFGCVNIYPDSPWVIPGLNAVELDNSLSAYRTIFTFSKSLIPVFYQLGARDVQWLPFAHDPKVHHPVETVEDVYQCDVAYLGCWGPIQERWLEPLSEECRLHVYGSGWDKLKANSSLRKCWKPGFGMGPNMAKAISGARLVFNIVRAEHGCAHSMKTFEVPACGGLMLMNWTEEQSMFFKDEKEAVLFNSFDEVADKAKYYLSHDTERTRICNAGLAAVEFHTYESRAKTLLQYMQTGQFTLDRCGCCVEGA